MTLAPTAQLVADAVAAGRAVAGFNVITLEHAEAIAEGAERAGTGAILQLSENAIRFHSGDPRALLDTLITLRDGGAKPGIASPDRARVADLDAYYRAGGIGRDGIALDPSRPAEPAGTR